MGALFLLADITSLVAVVLAASTFAWTTVLFGVVLVSVLLSGGLYRTRFTLSVLDDGPSLVGRSLAAGALAGLAAAALAAPFPLGSVAVAAVFLVVIVAMRAVAYQAVRSLRASRRISSSTLILGAGMVGQELALTMQERPRYGLDVVGFVDDSPLVTGAASAAPVLGGTAELPQLLAEHDIDVVVIAFTAMTGEKLVDVVRAADRMNAEICVVPRLFELAGRARDTDEVNGLPLTRLRRAPFRTVTWRLKRAMDVLLSATALVVLSPLLAVVALALRLVDGPGVLFRQERVGIDGRRFQLLKFRSLRPADDAESRTKWSIKDDQRISPLGRVIRKASIDELPQLWNVLRGDMSLVGPRPERPYFVDTFGEAYPRYGARHRVPSGLTGWAQIHGLRGDTSIEERARFDNYYVENWSLWLDLKIMLRTLSCLLHGG